jgi:hypothetical protein
MDLALLEFTESGAELAESVKRNILKAKNNVAVIDDETVNKLNRFMQAFNAIADLRDYLNNNVARMN